MQVGTCARLRFADDSDEDGGAAGMVFVRDDVPEEGTVDFYGNGFRKVAGSGIRFRCFGQGDFRGAGAPFRDGEGAGLPDAGEVGGGFSVEDVGIDGAGGELAGHSCRRESGGEVDVRFHPEFRQREINGHAAVFFFDVQQVCADGGQFVHGEGLDEGVQGHVFGWHENDHASGLAGRRCADAAYIRTGSGRVGEFEGRVFR